DPVEWYVRPRGGGAAFALFPWFGFLFAGAAVGLWLDAAHEMRRERIVNISLAAIGIAMTAGGYYASFLPAIYRESSFWGSSPTFFFIRLGMVIALVPIAYFWNVLPGRFPLREFG